MTNTNKSESIHNDSFSDYGEAVKARKKIEINKPTKVVVEKKVEE